MTVNELLLDRDLTTALIIDDAYDVLPLAKDLGADEEAWNTFIADIVTERDTVIELFPEYEHMTAEELRASDRFVAAMWSGKGKLSDENWNALFDDYSRATASDRSFLDVLEAQLKVLGIASTQSGRQLPANVPTVPLIFADLFLGTTQDENDVDESVEKLKKLLSGRESDPPVVVLMSRSDRLRDRTADFRDKAGLLGALFRVSSKADLVADANLEKLLRRMAQHRPDALRVARFLKSWADGLDEAKKQFMISMRRLDLSDYVQVRQVLLNFEGQPLGSYLLDVFDRVLQYEIEGNSGTIGAAEDLNNIDPDSYAVPYIAQSADLQHLVFRTIAQNRERLKVRATDCGAPVGFGDLLILTQAKTNAEIGEHKPAKGAECCSGVTNETLPDAFLVLTPACDLVRDAGASRVLLLAGETMQLDPKSWNYRDSPAPKTPIIEIDETHRVWIKWDTRDLRMLTPSEITAWLRDEQTYKVVARLRESNALEIQQKVLSSMGRIGLLAPMPATFEVNVRAYYQGADGVAHDYDAPALVREGGVCFVGRDEEGKENLRLVLTEQAIDDLMASIGKLDRTTIATAAQRNFDALKASKTFEGDVQRGLQVPSGTNYKAISCRRENTAGENSTDVVGAIARNPLQGATLNASHKCLVIDITDKRATPLEND